METRARQLGHMTARMVCGFICVLLMSRFMFYCGSTCVLFMMIYDSLVFAFMLRLRCFMLVLYVFGLCKALSLRFGSYRRSPLGLPNS